MNDEITTGQARQALAKHFQDMVENPSWGVICGLIRELDPEYCEGLHPWNEVEEYLHDLWTRAEITFKDKP